MNVSPAIIDFCEPLFDAFSQDLIEPLINLGLLNAKISWPYFDAKFRPGFSTKSRLGFI
jgi:hypothetical protein